MTYTPIQAKPLTGHPQPPPPAFWTSLRGQKAATIANPIDLAHVALLPRTTLVQCSCHQMRIQHASAIEIPAPRGAPGSPAAGQGAGMRRRGESWANGHGPYLAMIRKEPRVNGLGGG